MHSPTTIKYYYYHIFPAMLVPPYGPHRTGFPGLVMSGESGRRGKGRTASISRSLRPYETYGKLVAVRIVARDGVHDPLQRLRRLHSVPSRGHILPHPRLQGVGGGAAPSTQGGGHGWLKAGRRLRSGTCVPAATAAPPAPVSPLPRARSQTSSTWRCRWELWPRRAPTHACGILLTSCLTRPCAC